MIQKNIGQERRSRRKPIRKGADLALQDLDERLAVVRDRVRGVAFGYHNGFYLFGRPGTSKTHSVRTTLAELGTPHHYHLGHLTPMGLFDLLLEQHDRVIVLDDVSAIFEQPVALQILLAALGNQPEGAGGRVVEYRRRGLVDTVQFSGGIICISNLELHPTPLLQAIKSRIPYLKYDPSDEQLAALMRSIAEKGWPAKSQRMTPKECREVAEFLIAESKRLGCRLDLRLLVDKAFPDYLQHRGGDTEAHWQDLVIATLEEQLVELRHTPKAYAGSRNDRKRSEQQVVQELLTAHSTPQARLAAWQERTGKSPRAFYRRLEEIGLNTL